MEIINLQEEQIEYIEERLENFDEEHITYTMDGCIQIGMEEGGKLIAGLDACITTFKILYVSTVFVDPEYRRKGIGTQLIREMEKRAAAMGVNTIRLTPLTGRERISMRRWDTGASAVTTMRRTAIPNTSS